MNSALHKKIKIKPNQKIGVINKPTSFNTAILPLPEGSKLSKSISKNDDVIFWFVQNSEQLEEQCEEVLQALSDNNCIWVGHPKGKSKIQTDLTRDHGWECIMKRTDLSYVNYISFDDIWSMFCIRKKSDKDRKREEKPIEREIFKYADSATKTILIPDDLQKALLKNKKAHGIFEALAFSHRREYVEWIITAKKTETRNSRIEGTIEKLVNGKKNPAQKN